MEKTKRKVIYKFGYKWYKAKGGYILKSDIDNENKTVAYIFYSGSKWKEDKISLDTALKNMEVIN